MKTICFTIFFTFLLSLDLSLHLENQVQENFGSMTHAPLVNDMGAFQDIVPLELPPGVGNMIPKLSLIYDSRGPLGDLGVGWSLSGISSISRTSSSKANNGFNDRLRINKEDNLSIDGQFLVLIGGSKFTSGSNYRTENETFSIVEAVGEHANSKHSPNTFEVKNKQGWTYTYGGSVNSKVVTNWDQDEEVLSWSITKMEDPLGNYVLFEYTRDVDKGTNYIHRIRYTGNDKIDGGNRVISEPPNEISFIYQENQHTIARYISGNKVLMDQLIKEIQVSTNDHNGGSFHKKYVFKYDKFQSKPYLTSVTACDDQGKCMNPLVFNYSKASFDFGGTANQQKFATNSADHVIQNDFNKDGRSDFMVRGTANQTKAFTLSGDTLKPLPIRGIPNNLNVRSFSKNNTIIADLDGNHLDDMLLLTSGSKPQVLFNVSEFTREDTITYTFKKFENSTENYHDNNTTQLVFAGNFRDQLYAEVIRINSSHNNVILSFDDKTDNATDVKSTNLFEVNNTTLWAQSNQAKVGDFDGDGRDELALKNGALLDYHENEFKINENFFNYHNTTFNDLFVIDVNSDGFADLMQVPNKAKVKVILSNGLKGLPAIVTNVEFKRDASKGFIAGKFFNSDLIQFLVYQSDHKHKIYEFADTTFEEVAAFEKDLGLDKDDLARNVTYYNINAYDNGLTSLLSFNVNNNVKISIAERAITGKISSIIDGFGKVDSVRYKSISKSDIYSFKQSISSELTPIISGYNCVSSYLTSNGNGGYNTTRYKYTNLKYNRNGRGMTGFGTVENQDLTNGITYTKTFSQHFPLKGRIISEVHTNSRGVEIYKKENEWTFQVYANGVLMKLLERNVNTEIVELKNLAGPVVELNETKDLANKLVARGVDLNRERLSKFVVAANENIDKACLMQCIDEFQSNALSYWPYIREDKVIKKALDNTIISKSSMLNTYGKYGFPLQIKHDFYDGSSLLTEYKYDHIEDKSIWILGLLINKISTSSLSNGQSSFRAEAYEYDSENGLLLKTIKEPSRPQFRIVETYEYDPTGQIAVKKTTDGLSTKFLATKYEKRYKRFAIEQTNTLNQKIKFDYDVRTGKVTSETDPNNLVTTHRYDKMGRRTSSNIKNDLDQITYGYGFVGSNDPVTSIVGDISYFTTSKSRGKEKVTTYFNSLHRKVAQKYHLLAQSANKNTFILEWNVYDQRGNVRFKSKPSVVQFQPNPLGGFCVSYDSIGTTLNYDILDRAIETILPDEKKITNQYFAFKEKETNNLGQTKTTIYDKKGQVKEIEDNLRNKVEFERDEWGRITKTLMVSLNGDRTEISQTSYNEIGKKESFTDMNGTVTYQYDGFGNLVQEKHNEGRVFDMKYDLIGRMTEKNSTDRTTTWTYDNKFIGQLDKVNDSDNKETEYTYDQFGRIIKVDQSIDTLSFSNVFSYNQQGDLRSKTYHDGFKVNYEYSNGLLINTKTDEGSLIWKAHRIDASANVIESEYGNGYRSVSEIDGKSGLLKGIQTGISRLNLGNALYYLSAGTTTNECDLSNDTFKPAAITTTLIQDFEYQYDNNYNMNWISNAVDNIESEYEYDDLNRLERINTSQKGIKTFRFYVYDAFGNIQFDSKLEKSYEYEDTYRLMVIGQSNGKVRFKYDEFGNIVSYNKIKIEYDLSNLPTKIKEGSNEILYRYGHDNRVYTKKVKTGNSESITIYPFSDQEVQIVAGKETSIRNYLVINGQLMAFTNQSDNESSQIFYVHKDHLGSIDKVTNADGIVVVDKRYEAFGQEISQTDAVKMDKGFGSHPTLSISGLVNMGGRLYASEIGRFLSADPFVQSPENLQSFNRYSYVLNNPLNYIDPSGFFFKKIFRAVKRVFKRVVKTAKKVVKEIERGIKKYGKQIVVVGVAIAVTAATGGAAAGLVPALLSGAAAGAAASATATLLNGGSFSDVISSALTGAATGALSAGIFYGVGSAFGNVEAFSGKHVMKIGAHGTAGGIQSEISGGSFEDGFIGSAITQAFAPSINNVDKHELGITFNRTAAAAVVGGTASWASGGDFGSGALSASFSRAYNDDSHARRTQATLRAAPKHQRILSKYEIENYRRLKFERAYAEGVKDATIYMGKKAIDIFLPTGFPPGLGPIMDDQFYRNIGMPPPGYNEL